MQQPQPSPADVNALVELYNNRRYEEAESQTRALLGQFQNFDFGWKLLGGILQMQGKDALPAFQKVTELMPDDPEAHFNIGVILKGMGRLEQAMTSYQNAIQLNPDYAEAHSNLGNTLKDLGRLDDAIVNYSRALEIKPDLADAHNNLGTAFKDLGRFDEAIASYRKAVALKPDFASAYYNLGNAQKELGQLEDAVNSYRRAIEIKPGFAEAHNNLGGTLNNLGQLDAALTCYRRAVEIAPDFAEAHSNLGNALKELRQFVAAVASYRKAVEIKPDSAKVFYNLGNALKELLQRDDAVVSYRRALALKPDYAEAHNNLGNALRELRQHDAAVANYRKAAELKPDYVEAHNNLGLALQELGQLDDAVKCLRRALEIKPDVAEAQNNLLFLYAYHALIDPHEYLVQARNWERACVPEREREAARHRILQHSPLAGRRLRVGYMSGDYRKHSMSNFVGHLFTYHDRNRIELFAYSTQSYRDEVTERLHALVDHWVVIEGMSDAEARDRIEVDDIDVLIDFSGHTRHNRLGVFARRAAPVQAYYLGYFASTGLTEMDYWIGDEIATPPETDSHFSERVWRLPRVWLSYEGKDDAPVSAWQPSLDGTIWLGSFNNLGKLTPATLALWAKVLHALPEGKLLLKTKGLINAGNRQRILSDMSGHGISPDRIDLQGSNITPGWSDHMSYYDRLDIALDPVGGVCGGTTSCDALWMAVPVVSFEGDRMASRMTASMLSAISHPEWIARSDAEYVDKVVALARDVEQRKVLRSNQRNRMANSPLCDARGLALSLENAYFEMFSRWCDKNFNEKSGKKN
jgi:protein O-GlcNAc transferase